MARAKAKPGTDTHTNGSTNGTVPVDDAQRAYERIIEEENEYKKERAHQLEVLRDKELSKRVARDIEREFGGDQRAFLPPASGRTLKESLKEPREGVKHTIEGLHTTGGNTLLVAQYKTGKTTLLLNLMKSLADRQPFLGKFEVAKLDGRIGFFNYELTPAMFLDWVEDLHIKHPERIADPWHLRGRNLNLADEERQEVVIEWCRENEIQFLFVDPATRAWRGMVEHEGDNVQIDAFTAVLDEIKTAAGIEDMLVSTHTGRERFEDDQERARGGTRLEDWMDHGWYLRRDKPVPEAPRFFRAMGREVALDAIALEFDPATGGYTTSGKHRDQQRLDSKVEQLLRALAASGKEKMKSGELEDAAGIDKNQIAKVRETAERDGLIASGPGPGNSKLHWLTEAGRERTTGPKFTLS